MTDAPPRGGGAPEFGDDGLPEPTDADYEAWVDSMQAPEPDSGESWMDDAWLDQAVVEQLDNQVPRFMRTAEEGESHRDKMNDAELKKARQQNKLRKRFFKWAGLTVVLSLLGNFILFAAFMKANGGKISDPVMIAWISATVVEVLGIAYIIANYLFDGKSRNEASAET